jgi:hypothetical protein
MPELVEDKISVSGNEDLSLIGSEQHVGWQDKMGICRRRRQD